MPQKIAQTVVNTFVKGLITEASPINFPPDASVDELNFELLKNGTRRRRKGIEYETDFEFSSFTVDTDDIIHQAEWENVSEIQGAEFLVLQVRNILYFYDKSIAPVSSSLKNFTVDLNAFSAGNSYDPGQTRISAASIGGLLVVVSNAIEPFFIEYDSSTDTISTSTFPCRIRDFEWMGDTTGYNAFISTAAVSDERKYDTYNSGWVTGLTGNPVLSALAPQFPPLGSPWHSYKNTNGDFANNVFKAANHGNSLSGNGRIIMSLWNLDRSQAIDDLPNVSDSVALPTEVEVERFSTVISYAGRVWFAGIPSKKNGSKVFFSKTIYNNRDFGFFYQEADPTAETISDLVDSDGGVINIPSAGKIKLLFEWGNSLLIFADNGVWEVKGVDGVFKATEYAVSRIREAVGLSNPYTVADADGTPVYWSHNGIMAITGDEVSGTPVGQDISKTTIQTFWDNIGTEFRAKAISAYDEYNKQVYWLYGDDNTNYSKYNYILIFDSVLQAFFPWTISDEAGNTSYITGISYFSGRGQVSTVFDVVADGDPVQADGNDVVVTLLVDANNDSAMKYIVVDGDSTNITFATMTADELLDWGSANYSSYADAFYVWGDALTLRKNNLYVTCFFELTEDGWTGSEEAGYTPTHPSACTLKSYWDLYNTVTSSQEAYRLLEHIDVDPGDLDTFTYPTPTIITRNRIRGRGRVLKLRFESQSGKDLRLLGYEVINARNSSL